MMRIRDLQFLTLANTIVAVVVVATSLLIWKKELSNPLERQILDWRPKKALNDGEKVEIGAILSLDESLKRPLFRSDRKPFDPNLVAKPPTVEASAALPTPLVQPPETTVLQPIQAPPPPLATVPQFALKGLAEIAGTKRALIILPEDPVGQWIARGETISGWKLVNLDDNAAHLKLDGKTVDLLLYVDNITKPVGSP
jgi:hypothetical protein